MALRLIFMRVIAAVGALWVASSALGADAWATDVAGVPLPRAVAAGVVLVVVALLVRPRRRRSA